VTHVVDGITVTDSALTQIVATAAEQVDGARVRRRGIALHDDRVEVALSARYGAVLPELARDVQAQVADALASMCDLQVRVDVSVDEVWT
jgi:uncharacterized alkaline shock family protein YloU